jgi:hypothetical protein
LILFHIFTTWDRDLDENNLVPQFRVIIQEGVKAFQLLRQAFDIVKSIDSHNDLHPFVPLFKGLDTVLDFLFLQGVCKLLRVNTNNVSTCAYQPVFILDLVWNLGMCSTDKNQSFSNI